MAPERSNALTFLAPTLLALAGCGGEPSSSEAFRGLELPVEALEERTVQLRDGRALLPEEGLEIVMDELHLSGSLDSVEGEVTSGFLYTTPEGAFSEIELVVALRDADGMRHLDSHLLGGPYRVEGLRYEGEEILVYLLDYAPDDAPCCPSVSLQRRFHLVDGELREVEIIDVEAVEAMEAGAELSI